MNSTSNTTNTTTSTNSNSNSNSNTTINSRTNQLYRYLIIDRKLNQFFSLLFKNVIWDGDQFDHNHHEQEHEQERKQEYEQDKNDCQKQEYEQDKNDCQKQKKLLSITNLLLNSNEKFKKYLETDLNITLKVCISLIYVSL